VIIVLALAFDPAHHPDRRGGHAHRDLAPQPYAGLSAVAMGFVLDNKLLVIAAPRRQLRPHPVIMCRP
jgi:hypothetical protein